MNKGFVLLAKKSEVMLHRHIDLPPLKS